MRSWPDASSGTENDDVDDLASTWQRQIALRLENRGFHIRLGTLADMAAIDHLHHVCRPRFSPAQRPSELVYYRLLRFGLPVLVDDDAGRLVAYNLVQLVADAERTALSAGIAVHPAAAGAGLGTELGRYTSLAAMAAGARVRRGTVHPANGASLTLFLNRLGAVCDVYYPALAGPGEGRLEYALPLHLEGLTRNAVDEARLAGFIARGEEGSDYRLLVADDDTELEQLYQTSSFRVVAFARAGLLGDEPRLIALPAVSLGLVSDLAEAPAA